MIGWVLMDLALFPPRVTSIKRISLAIEKR
jgi:hypothetical protein